MNRPTRRRQARDHRGFRQVQLINGFGVVDPGRIGDAVGARAQINVVEVLVEDLIFAELALELQRQAASLTLRIKV